MNNCRTPQARSSFDTRQAGVTAPECFRSRRRRWRTRGVIGKRRGSGPVLSTSRMVFETLRAVGDPVSSAGGSRPGKRNALGVGPNPRRCQACVLPRLPDIGQQAIRRWEAQGTRARAAGRFIRNFPAIPFRLPAIPFRSDDPRNNPLRPAHGTFAEFSRESCLDSNVTQVPFRQVRSRDIQPLSNAVIAGRYTGICLQEIGGALPMSNTSAERSRHMRIVARRDHHKTAVSALPTRTQTGR